jgi:hypothetical protein
MWEREGGGSIQLYPSAGEGWTAVAARTLFDDGDDPRLTDSVGPTISDGRIGQAEREGGDGPNRTSEAGRTH